MHIATENYQSLILHIELVIYQVQESILCSFIVVNTYEEKRHFQLVDVLHLSRYDEP